ncbi:MAG: S-layer homology domain-containing protein [Erysipelotrichia bacterium]|nr:S-layer homology domain-containing protein [Erysipelotrichia bacterium]
MLQGSALKKIQNSVLSAILFLGLTSCRQETVDAMTLGEWIAVMNEHAGISGYSQQAPYYLNIPASSELFDEIQASVEWKVLDPAHAFDPKAVLTREWTAGTLIHLSGRNIENQTGGTTIRDNGSSEFPDEIQAAVSSGLMKLDKNKCFRPKKPIDRTEAVNLLYQVVEYINTKEVETPVNELEWDKSIEFTEEKPEIFDPDTGKALFRPGASISNKEIVSIQDPHGTEIPYRICEIEDTSDGHVSAQLEEVPVEDLIEHMEAADSFELDFSNAEITDDNGSVLFSSSGINETETMSIRPKTVTKQISGYQVSYTITSAGIKAEVSKKTPNGINLYSEISLNSVKPIFKFKIDHGQFEEGYFRVDFDTSESIGAKRSESSHQYANLKDVDAIRFLSSVRSAFSSERDTAKLSVPICTVKVPIPSVPIMSMLARIELQLTADGRAELTLNQHHSTGMEIRNGAIRMINDHDHSSETMIKASTSMLGGIYFGIN